jgi:membrane protein YdbS with pleckstrin-like domain
MTDWQIWKTGAIRVLIFAIITGTIAMVAVLWPIAFLIPLGVILAFALLVIVPMEVGDSVRRKRERDREDA